jgi:hypothetical protein
VNRRNRQPPIGLDLFDQPIGPKVEPCDDLSRFVMDCIRLQETEPRTDMVVQSYDETAGPMAHRYAGKVREDCKAFRRIVALYVEAHTAGNADQGFVAGARAYTEAAVLVLANRWSTVAGFREEWRLD